MMIRRVNLLNLLFQNVHFRDKCRVLQSAMSTSYACQNRHLKNSRIEVKQNKHLNKSTTKYEDTFGNLESLEQMFERIKDDPEDILEYQRDKAALGKTIGQYIKEVKSHLDNYDYKSALRVLEVDMVNDRKRLCPFIYKLLINYNAKIGNLEEAYRLFINFKKRRGIVTGAMYTSMFNACANCKNSSLALEKANAITECMRNNKHHTINVSNYNVMLKAFGRHADLTTCLKIVDEVSAKRNKVKAETYNFLLQACISDRNSGLRHALIVWRKMIQNLVKPDCYSFNLMLRCVNDCSLGDALLIPSILDDIKKESGKFFKTKEIFKIIDGEVQKIIQKVPASGYKLLTSAESETKSKLPEKNKDFIQVQSIESSHLALEGRPAASESQQEASQIESHSLGNQLSNKSNESIVSESAQNFSSLGTSLEKPEETMSVPDITSLSESELPNLISVNPSVGSIVKFGVMTQPIHRFILLGGMQGFLKTMAEFGVTPNVKTLTLMLNVIPSTLEAEQELLAVAETHKIKLDTPFFNMLIRRRFFRDEDSSVKTCLEQMYSLNLTPDLLTFGVLAIGCHTYELGMDLLKTLRNHGYRANTEILETLLKKARYARDMKYVLAILQVAKEDEANLSQRFVAQLSNLVSRERYLRKKDAEKLEESEETPASLSSS